jgi:hypothetical protein
MVGHHVSENWVNFSHNSTDQADDLGTRLEVTKGGTFCHPATLIARPARLNKFSSDSASEPALLRALLISRCRAASLWAHWVRDWGRFSCANAPRAGGGSPRLASLPAWPHRGEGRCRLCVPPPASRARLQIVRPGHRPRLPLKV